LRGLHDIYEPENPPQRQPIPILRPSDRIGSPVVKVDPRRILGVVETNQPDETGAFSEVEATTRRSVSIGRPSSRMKPELR
jgi:acyl-CoA hydrolase